MTKWYDRIGNTIEMNIDNQWIKGTIVNGYRTHDGLINMKTEDGKNCWCGVNGEYVHFRKCRGHVILSGRFSNSRRLPGLKK